VVNADAIVADAERVQPVALGGEICRSVDTRSAPVVRSSPSADAERRRPSSSPLGPPASGSASGCRGAGRRPERARGGVAPEFSLADGRAGEVTVRHLLTHTSGIPDVIDYGWHVPDLGDDALQRFVLGLRFQPDEYAWLDVLLLQRRVELLGHLLVRVSGHTFETAVKQLVLDPVNMHRSTFLRADVPPDRAAPPHVGVPLTTPQGVYPYTRSHAPSSTLHSSTDDLCRWMLANYPGFGSKLILVPKERTGVVVLANSNTAPTDAVARAALDVALGVRPDHGSPAAGEDPAHLTALLPPAVGPVAAALVESGTEAAVAAYGRLASAQPATVDLDDERFVDGVWGRDRAASHRPGLAPPSVVDLRPAAVVAGLDNDGMGTQGRRPSRARDEVSPTGTQSRRGQPRRGRDPEEHSVGHEQTVHVKTAASPVNPC
jgi:hypothetical protein